jgi:hypothetical protein
MQSYKFSQALKNLISREKTPGPGSYTCETTTLVHNGGSISKEKRDFNYSNNIPGPGNYREVSVESVKNREPRVTYPIFYQDFQGQTLKMSKHNLRVGRGPTTETKEERSWEE